MTWQGEMNWDGSLVGLSPDMATVGPAHEASHVDPARFTKIINWYSGQFANFIQKLKVPTCRQRGRRV